MEHEKVQPVEMANVAKTGIVTGVYLGSVIWLVIFAIVYWMYS